MSEQQRTVANELSLNGVGIHTGQAVSLRVLPAGPNVGVVFIRSDLPHRPTISVKSGQVVDESQSFRRTTLTKDGVQIQTVEHFMAALWGMGIDNVYVEVSGSEMPGLDGSSAPLLAQLKTAGTVEQSAPRRFLSVREPVFVEEGDSCIAVFPGRHLSISYLLSYDHPLLKSQFVSYAQDGAAFETSIAPARTFCLKEEADALRAAGFGKGATFENTLVLGERGVMNNTLRFEDEFARHKILDLLGDLYLLGAPLRARVMAIRSGHTLNVKLVKKLSQAFEQWKVGSLSSATSDVMVGPQLDITQIQKILPHRYPFLLVDRIIELTKTPQSSLACSSLGALHFGVTMPPPAPALPPVPLAPARPPPLTPELPPLSEAPVPPAPA